MTPIKRSVTFSLDSKKKGGQDGRPKAPKAERVRCVVTWNSNRARLGTGHAVNPACWSADLMRCSAKSFHGKGKVPAAAVNRDLEEIEIMVDAVFREFEDRDAIPTKDEFMEAYKRKSDPKAAAQEAEKKAETVLHAYDAYVREGYKEGRWSDSTLGVANTIRKHIQGLGAGLTFAGLEKLGPAGVLSYFTKKGLSNSTILKDMSLMRSFLRWAGESGRCAPSKLLTQRPKLKTAKKPVVFLTWDELMAVYGHDFGAKAYLSQVRDVFCFCCFTSLRYSDARNLKRANISDSAITITTVKTHDTLTIELNKYSRAILAKYKGFELPGGKALPVISNQKMNNYIKEMGQICGLDAPISVTSYQGAARIDKVYKKWELLSTHAGRRTFVCIALMLGIPPNIVMKWTGHSDYDAMRPYIEIADEAKRSAMTAFDSAFDSAEKKAGQKEGQKGEHG